MATPAPQPCEQCNRHPSVLYCLTCARHICLSCEDSHAYNHSVVSTANALKCAEHKLPFDLYCENCEKLVCATCYQKHANLQHIISAIQQVFRKKQNVIVSLMTEAAFEKKAAIQAQAGRLTKRIHDLKSYKSVLESDVYQFQDQILSRLQTWVAPITQRLEKEREVLGRDLDALDSSLRIVNSSDKIQFLTSYRSVVATLETVAARPITAETEVAFEEMPREMQEIRTKVQESVMQKTINQARNDVIWDMLKTYPADSQASDAATKREILQWSRLTDKLLQQVADLQFICYLCKAKVAPESVNEDCSMNPVGVVKGELSRDPLIPPSILGNGFHFIVSQHGDIRKQSERFRLAEQPRSKFQLQESVPGIQRRAEPAGRDFGESSWKKYEAEHGRGTSLGSEGVMGSPAPKPSGFQSGAQTGSDFGRTTKSGFNMLETAAGSSFRQSYTSPSQSLGRRDEYQLSRAENPNVVTFGGDLRDSANLRENKPGTGGAAGRESWRESMKESGAGRWESSAGYVGSGKFTESFGSSFNPMDSFGVYQAQSEKPAATSQRTDPSLSKEVRFSYSDSFKSPTPASQLPASTKETALKPAIRAPAGQGANWREKVKSALLAASAMFLSSCKTYDNGAGEIPIDGLRVCLHKASHLLSIDDIDQAAKYVGRDHVNYASFLSAMTRS